MIIEVKELEDCKTLTVNGKTVIDSGFTDEEVKGFIKAFNFLGLYYRIVYVTDR